MRNVLFPHDTRPSLRPEQGSGNSRKSEALSADRHAAAAIALLAHFLHIILVGIDDLDRPFVPRVPAVFAVGGVAKVATELLLRFEDVGLVIIPILVHDAGDRLGADRSEEHRTDLQSYSRHSFAGICLINNTNKRRIG